MTVSLLFDKGTLILDGLGNELERRRLGVAWDDRTRTWRAPAWRYRDVVMALREKGLPYADKARLFSPLQLPFAVPITPRSHQAQALKAWQTAGSRGVVVLPTGAGKTILACLAIHATGRPTLVHVPTIDLMHQWMEVLKKHFGVQVGLLGGGYNEVHDLTVATYDSAVIHVPHRGNRFGLAVFDECHHLPGDQTRFAALASLAPFRLGLTATPERSDGREKDLEFLCGPEVYRTEIRELKGSTLSTYEVCTLELELSPEERAEYDENRQIYREFVKLNGIDFSSQNGWRQFLWKAHRSPEGREAFRAYLTQKKIAQASRAKLDAVWDILARHRGERVLVFTQDNDMAYRIGTEFFLPVLTHHTKVREREEFLKRFRDGTYRVLVTSKVLNEGVDVPEASVAIVVSGSGTVREHVQRLGRILRAAPGKHAILYELVSEGTAERYVNQRRRQHSAYQESVAFSPP